MPISYPFTEQEYKALNHLRRCMEKFDYGSKEYERARKAYAFICEKVRMRQKDNATK